jgi:DNA-binding IclR family transcriptional regulator
MNHYMLGPGFLRLVQGAMQGIGGITAVAKPSLVSLWEKTEETVTVHVRVGSERVCIEEIPSPQPIRYISTLGAAAPLHVGAAGKVLLAFMDAGELDQLLKTLPLTPLSDKTTTNVEVLLAELETVRRRGYAISMGERIKGAAAVTVPVRGLQGFAASLSILGPVDRLPHKRLVELVPVLQETSAEIEQALTMSGARGRVVEAVS